MTREATGEAALFYGQLTDKVVQVSSCRAAEMASFLENTFRQVNVGLVNEMAVFCREQGLDVWEVADAAATKPFGFMPFSPGQAPGGYNLQFALAQRAEDQSQEATSVLRIVEQARTANSLMPDYVASRIEHALSEKGRDVRGARVLALGVTYKPNVGDTLESPALKVLHILRERGARISYHDPYAPQVMLNGDMVSRTHLTERSVEAADCVAILTPHRAYDLDWISRHAWLVFDAHNAYGPDRRPNVVRL
jgi:UDP-N-acetyl-D-glucosamine dehydrogenase